MPPAVRLLHPPLPAATTQSLSIQYQPQLELDRLACSLTGLYNEIYLLYASLCDHHCRRATCPARSTGIPTLLPWPPAMVAEPRKLSNLSSQHQVIALQLPPAARPNKHRTASVLSTTSIAANEKEPRRISNLSTLSNNAAAATTTTSSPKLSPSNEPVHQLDASAATISTLSAFPSRFRGISPPVYCRNVLKWLVTKFDDSTLFPTDAAIPFPTHRFIPEVSAMVRRLARVVAHMEMDHHQDMEFLAIADPFYKMKRSWDDFLRTSHVILASGAHSDQQQQHQDNLANDASRDFANERMESQPLADPFTMAPTSILATAAAATVDPFGMPIPQVPALPPTVPMSSRQHRRTGSNDSLSSILSNQSMDMSSTAQTITSAPVFRTASSANGSALTSPVALVHSEFASTSIVSQDDNEVGIKSDSSDVYANVPMAPGGIHLGFSSITLDRLSGALKKKKRTSASIDPSVMQAKIEAVMGPAHSRPASVMIPSETVSLSSPPPASPSSPESPTSQPPSPRVLSRRSFGLNKSSKLENRNSVAMPPVPSIPTSQAAKCPSMRRARSYQDESGSGLMEALKPNVLEPVVVSRPTHAKKDSRTNRLSAMFKLEPRDERIMASWSMPHGGDAERKHRNHHKDKSLSFAEMLRTDPPSSSPLANSSNSGVGSPSWKKKVKRVFRGFFVSH